MTTEQRQLAVQEFTRQAATRNPRITRLPGDWVERYDMKIADQRLTYWLDGNGYRVLKHGYKGSIDEPDAKADDITDLYL